MCQLDASQGDDTIQFGNQESNVCSSDDLILGHVFRKVRGSESGVGVKEVGGTENSTISE